MNDLLTKAERHAEDRIERLKIALQVAVDNARRLSSEDSLKRDALISLSATYGANIKHEWERIGRGSLYRDTLEAALSELDPKFSDLCVDAFYNAMKMTVNEAIALVSEERDPVDEMISWEEAGIKSVTFEGKKYDADSEEQRTFEAKGVKIEKLELHPELDDERVLEELDHG